MRVVHVTPYFAPAFRYGGPPRSVLGLCRALGRAGADVRVVTTSANGVDATADRRLARIGRRVADETRGAVVGDLAPVALALFAASHQNYHEYQILHCAASSRAATSIHSTSVTSYSRLPLGLCTVTVSPISLPISARATGAPIEIRPFLMSASCSPTIV